jgi:hypothetical protein
VGRSANRTPQVGRTSAHLYADWLIVGAAEIRPTENDKMPKTINTFEDLVAWQIARQLAREVYRMTSQPVLQRDFWRWAQLRRSAVSTMSHIAEAFARGGRAECHQFLAVARGRRCRLRNARGVSSAGGEIQAGTHDRPRPTHSSKAAARCEGLTPVAGYRPCIACDRQPPTLRYVLRPTCYVLCGLSAGEQPVAPPRDSACPLADSPPPTTSTR